MPAKSKSQQRLFGMVHAYNKGEFHGPRSLRERIARLSHHISDTDAKHFAKTKHDNLPEKAAEDSLAFLDEAMATLANEAKNRKTINTVKVGDRIRVMDGIRCFESGKPGKVIAVREGKDGQIAVIKMDNDGSVFSGYTASYVGEILPATKSAQLAMRPEQIQAMMAQMPPVDYSQFLQQEERPKPIVDSALKGLVLGTATGGLVGSGLGGVLSYQATKGQPVAARTKELLKALVRCGFWGASRGAVAGTAIGTGANIFNRMRS